jgi:hypothetical protein
LSEAASTALMFLIVSVNLLVWGGPPGNGWMVGVRTELSLVGAVLIWEAGMASRQIGECIMEKESWSRLLLREFGSCKFGMNT